MPQTSDMSNEVTFPRNIDATNDDTRDMRDVSRYFLGYFVLKRRIWGPVNRY